MDKYPDFGESRCLLLSSSGGKKMKKKKTVKSRSEERAHKNSVVCVLFSPLISLVLFFASAWMPKNTESP